ncbi:MAG TPA: deoxyribodipyrimidine photo-lyase [Acidimicrobiales bacterium]|nr:deoxyribodipyrimidine photo-lyase [Acidimicrobiales bacterium]
MADRPTILWFRRDLRLADHPALLEAAERGPVLGLFVLDERLWGPAGPNRRWFLAGCLDALHDAVDGTLVVRHGDPIDVVAAVAAEADAASVLVSADFGPYGHDRDLAVEARLAAEGVGFERIGSPYAVDPGRVLTGGGTPYKVFSPFYRAWTEHGWDPPAGPPVAVDWVRGVRSDPRPTAPAVDAALPAPGEGPAHDRLDAFIDERVTDYRDARNQPGIEGTSRLSPYLKWGCVHPRQILARLGDSRGEEVFRSEVAWREFYADVLHHRPDSARAAFVPTLASIEVDEGPDADARFAAWAEGRTGYPIVDAGMRQLLAEGWMHNRVRMIVASFLVKDLHLDWTRGARHFMRHLVDGDLASNQHGWQWVAGTGTDAAPYFRVFNPVAQGRKFDPDGTYVRRWVPELAGLDERRVHEPWTAGDTLRDDGPNGYPPPIVDHAEERREALARYEAARAAPASSR